jgi:hypothetical protein
MFLSIVGSARLLLLLVVMQICHVFQPVLNDTTLSLIDVEDVINNSSGMYKIIFWIVIFLAGFFLFFKGKISFNTSFNVWGVAGFFLIFLAGVSVFWSDFFLIAAKRYVLLLMIIIVITTIVVIISDSKDVAWIIYNGIAISIIVDLISCISGSGFDTDGYVRGIHAQKNSMGQIAAIQCLTWFYIKDLKVRRFVSFYIKFIFISSLVLLLLSGSKTSIALFFIIPLVVFVVNRVCFFMKFDLGSFYVGIITVLLAINFSILFSYPELYKLMLELLTGDASLTGRGAIWEFVIGEGLNELWLGYGYGSFWGVGESSIPFMLGDSFIAKLYQAHNGYIDIWLQLGLVGLFLIILVNFRCFILIGKIKDGDLVVWFTCLLLFILINNVTESSMFRSSSFLSVIYILVIVSVGIEAKKNKGRSYEG